MASDYYHPCDGPLIDEIVDTLTEAVGVRLYNSTLDRYEYVFRGPHGRLEIINEKKRHDQWARSPYVVQDTARLYIAKAATGNQRWTRWRYVLRESAPETEPVVTESMDPKGCDLCNEVFDSGHAFALHLADVHEVDTDDHLELAFDPGGEQRTLAAFAGGGS